MPLKNKVAIVTGGNSGIGKAIVLELAKQGAKVSVDYVCHPDATEELERQVAALGDQVTAHRFTAGIPLATSGSTGVVERMGS